MLNSRSRIVSRAILLLAVSFYLGFSPVPAYELQGPTQDEIQVLQVGNYKNLHKLGGPDFSLAKRRAPRSGLDVNHTGFTIRPDFRRW